MIDKQRKRLRIINDSDDYISSSDDDVFIPHGNNITPIYRNDLSNNANQVVIYTNEKSQVLLSTLVEVNIFKAIKNDKINDYISLSNTIDMSVVIGNHLPHSIQNNSIECFKYITNKCIDNHLRLNKIHEITDNSVVLFFLENITTINCNENSVKMLKYLFKHNNIKHDTNDGSVFEKCINKKLFKLIKYFVDAGFVANEGCIKNIWWNLFHSDISKQNYDLVVSNFAGLQKANDNMNNLVSEYFNNDNIVKNCLEHNNILSEQFDKSRGEGPGTINTFTRIMKEKFGLRKND